MVMPWEQEIYDEILEAYERARGSDIREDPFVYFEIVKLMEILRKEYGYDREKLKEVITNSIVLMLALFFKKDDDDFDAGRELTKEEQDQMKALLQDAYKIATSNSTA